MHTPRRLTQLSNHLIQPRLSNLTHSPPSKSITTTTRFKMPLINPTGTAPRVILGLMTFGPPSTESKGARITDMATYQQCLDTLLSKNYTELDTARMYIQGDQEAWTRDAGFQSKGFSIATKCYPVEPGAHAPDRLKETFNKSLAELGVKTVEIFYLHAPDRSVPFEDTLKACNELFKEGKFVKLGLSNFAAWEVAEVVNICRERGWVQPKIYQAMYNAITRGIESELIPCCRKYKIDIVIYNPLAGGLFSGKYNSTDKSTLPTEGRFANTASRVGQMYRDRYFKDSTFEALALIEPVAKKHDLTLLETALRWCVHHSKLNVGSNLGPGKNGGNDGVIVGVSGLKQLEQNLEDLEKGPLPDEVVEALDQAWEVTRGTAQTYWR